MSPELALAAIVAALWGPTAVWILFRVVRGKPQRSEFTTGSPSSGTEPRSRAGAAALAELVDGGAFWACASCHSLNRPAVSRCYSCAKLRRDAGEPGGSAAPRVRDRPRQPLAPPEPVASRPPEAPWEPRTSRAPRAPRAPLPPLAPRQPRAPEAPGLVPVMAVLPASADRAPVAVGPGIDAAAASHAVCPFVRLAGNPATWDPEPSRANRCHAGVAPTGASRHGSPRRPEEIAPETQQALCLSAWYTACGRLAAAGTGRLPDPPEPEVAMMVAMLRAAAVGDVPAAPVAPGGAGHGDRARDDRPADTAAPGRRHGSG